jgi:CubicO group peptidase (beta-lactamase class C family)
VEALRQIDGWDAPYAAAFALRQGQVESHGADDQVVRWASITALAVLVAAEEGTVDLDEPAGPPGATVRHLLAHASGLPFDPGPPIGRPGARRIYSNHGYAVLAEHLAGRAEMPFAEYLRAAVLEPLGLRAELRGDAGAGLHGDLRDLQALARELLAPTLVSGETFAEATTVQFPGLGGVLPGIGRYDPLDWGLGFELRDGKEPHWTGTLASPRTFGHFGGSGTFLWVDPERQLALGALTTREFGDWALEAWPALSDAVVRDAVAT